MNLCTVQFLSQVLGRHVPYTAILPDPAFGEGPFPVLFQLHGASDDHTMWLLASNLVRYVAPLPLITVLPDGGLSFWLNRGPRERYEDFVVQDLLPHVARTFHVRTGKAAIGGLSMGGFGAMYLGLRHPDRFASIWAHSGAFRSEAELVARGWSPATAHLADPDTWVPLGPDEATELPAVSFDCGLEDPLLEGNRALHRRLAERGIPHTYREHPGGHTWEYWDTHVREALAEHARVLGLEAAASG